MGRLIYIGILFIGFLEAKTQVSSEFDLYRRIAMDLDALVVHENGTIGSDHRKWLLLGESTSPSHIRASNIMAKMNELALVPGYPVLTGLERTSARDHNGSRLIAVSREAVTKESGGTGRYAIMQTFDPDSVWATWLDEEDVQRIFGILGRFDPAGEPLLFPEVEERREAERLAREREEKAVRKMIEARDSRRRQEAGSDAKDGGTTTGSQGGSGSTFLSWTVGLAALLLLGIGLWIYGKAGQNR